MPMAQHNLAGTALLALTLALAGCNNADKRPYLGIAGGGFIFNYREAVAYGEVILVPGKPLPEGATVEVTMQDPAGGPPIVMTERPTGQQRIEFDSRPLTGIKVDTDYAVTVRLLDARGAELQRIDKTFRSDVDQSALPSVPLTVGPGYAKNPAAQ